MLEDIDEPVEFRNKQSSYFPLFTSKMNNYSLKRVSLANGCTDLAHFLNTFVIVRTSFLAKEDLEKLPGKFG